MFEVSVDVESVHSGNEKLDRTIMSPQFFNAKEHEDIVFKSTGGTKTGENTWDITGADVLGALRWAQDRAGDHGLYAVALVRDERQPRDDAEPE